MYKKSQAGFANLSLILLILLVLGTVVGYFLSQNPQVFRPKAFENISKEDFLTKLSDLETKFGQKAVDQELKGVLSKKIEDNFETEGAEYKEFYTLTTNPDQEYAQIYQVIFTGDAPQLDQNTEVTLKGKSVNNYLVVDPLFSNTQLQNLAKITEQKIPTTGNANKIAVVFVKFSNSQSFAPNTLEPTLYDSSNSLAAYFSEVSYGKFTLSKSNFTLFTNNGGWYTFSEPEPASTLDCWTQIWRSGNYAKNLIGSSVLQSYQHIMYVYPKISGCSPISGYGDLNTSSTTQSWILTGSTDSFAYIHEFAHNLGIKHASGLTCNSQAIDTYPNCTIHSYADWYDPMGGASRITQLKHKPYHLSAAHKQALGWLDLGKHVVEHTNGTAEYLIYPVSKPPSDNEIKSVRIKRYLENGRFEYYYLDVRGRMGFDELLYNPPHSDICTYPLDGLGIHLWDGIPSSDTKLVSVNLAEYIQPSLCADNLANGSTQASVFSDTTYGNNIQVKVVTGASNQYSTGPSGIKPIRISVTTSGQTPCERLKGICADSKGENQRYQCNTSSYRSDASYKEGGCTNEQYPYCYTDCKPK